MDVYIKRGIQLLLVRLHGENAKDVRYKATKLG